jgi:cephalosporin hydroxylase
MSDDLLDRFHRRWYRGPDTWESNSWLGVKTLKCPLDLWIYQEILFRTRPDLIVETGTARGGSAYYLAGICDLIGTGRIVTIDVGVSALRPEHPRITYLTGSSTDPGIVAGVRDAVRPGERVMVLLDSDHSKQHVLEELRAYAPLVTEGNYLVVEDTNVNGHPVMPQHGPGPMEALEEFLGEDAATGFIVDRDCERLLLTFNPSGFLLRTPV